MDLSYRKNDNRHLFTCLAENEKFGISQPQNYIPIYDKYFSLSNTNFNNITLNHQNNLYSLKTQETNNIFKGVLRNEEKKETKKVFLKYSPLMDPTKYLFGKYDISNQQLLNLPSYLNTECDSKVKDPNNAAYVDGFFTYLSSQLLHNHSFYHGLDFYGSFLAKQSEFRYNVTDDLEYLQESEFFHKNNNVLYELENNCLEDVLNSDTRNYKKKINILEDFATKENDIGLEILNLSDITDLTQLDSMVSTTNENSSPELLFQGPQVKGRSSTNVSSNTSSTSSSCSSRSSNTENNDTENDIVIDKDAAADGDEADGDVVDGDEAADEAEADAECHEADANEEDDEADAECDEDDEDEAETDDDEEEEEVIAKIKNFPVQVISLECCEDTLDAIMMEGNITLPTWDSIVLQILFSLITFQNAFSLTHNDLHTNNIMYVKTEKKFLFYKLNHTYYKVPTYGRLFKIIDFGRAIYRFKGQLLCSDSYHPKGDAATQYNCEPYFNDKKPRIEPNFSFDLCRLGCALYDSIVDEPPSPIIEIMLKWCNDDKGRNILYKKNGEERYPDFKLYKMIARTVHQHVPLHVLTNPYFDKYIIPKKEVQKNAATIDLIDIDAIPCYI